MSNSLDPDQTKHFVRPDLDPICLQKLSVDGNSWQRVNSDKCLSACADPEGDPPEKLQKYRVS